MFCRFRFCTPSQNELYRFSHYCLPQTPLLLPAACFSFPLFSFIHIWKVFNIKFRLQDFHNLQFFDKLLYFSTIIIYIIISIICFQFLFQFSSSTFNFTSICTRSLLSSSMFLMVVYCFLFIFISTKSWKKFCHQTFSSRVLQSATDFLLNGLLDGTKSFHLDVGCPNCFPLI